MDLAIPKLRHDTYLPEWLLAPRRRAERALVAVVAQCYVEGRRLLISEELNRHRPPT
jgi:putative transposase